MKNKNPYKSKKLTAFAKENRKSPTYGEQRFWQSVRGRRLLGYKFRRQTPILHYIVNFYCEELSLVIEIDGSSHDESNRYTMLNGRLK